MMARGTAAVWAPRQPVWWGPASVRTNDSRADPWCPAVAGAVKANVTRERVVGAGGWIDNRPATGGGEVVRVECVEWLAPPPQAASATAITNAEGASHLMTSRLSLSLSSTVDLSTTMTNMNTVAPSTLDGAALEAWRSYLQSHASIVRVLDAELVAEHGMTARDYEVLLYLSQAEGQHLPMSALAERTMLTRSGITRLIDGLVHAGWIEREACPNDARVSYAQLTAVGHEKLRDAGCSHVRSIRRLFLEHFTSAEIDQLASLLRRLPGAHPDGACTAE